SVLACSVALGFFVSGALLSSVAWQRAWRPPLRVAFEELARAARAQAEKEGRRLPEDDEAFAIVEGTLRADAAPTENGVSLSLAVDAIVGPEGQEGQGGREKTGALEGAPRLGLERSGRGASEKKLASGGVIVTVVGALAADHFEGWKSGRRVRL